MKILLLMLVLGTALQSSAQNEQAPAVKHPYRIMVAGDPGDTTTYGKDQELIRSKLISSLSKRCSHYCIVVEPAIEDDTKVSAILTGSWRVVEDCWNGCSYSMQGSMRLIAKDGSVIWSDTVYSNRFARSASSSFADNVAKKLVSHLASKPLPAAGE